MNGSPSRPLLTAAAVAVMALTFVQCDAFSDALDIPISFDHDFNVRADIGAATGAAAGQPSPADATYPLTIGAVPVDLISASPDLAKNRSKVQAIELTQIIVTPTTNSLTSATPPIDLYIGPAGATTVTQAIKVATLPAIPAGSSDAAQATIDAAAQDAAQQYLTSFDFTIIPVATLAVSAGETVPGGAVDLNILMGIKATLNPVK